MWIFTLKLYQLISTLIFFPLFTKFKSIISIRFWFINHDVITPTYWIHFMEISSLWEWDHQAMETRHRCWWKDEANIGEGKGQGQRMFLQTDTNMFRACTVSYTICPKVFRHLTIKPLFLNILIQSSTINLERLNSRFWILALGIFLFSHKRPGSNQNSSFSQWWPVGLRSGLSCSSTPWKIKLHRICFVHSCIYSMEDILHYCGFPTLWQQFFHMDVTVKCLKTFGHILYMGHINNLPFCQTPSLNRIYTMVHSLNLHLQRLCPEFTNAWPQGMEDKERERERGQFKIQR